MKRTAGRSYNRTERPTSKQIGVIEIDKRERAGESDAEGAGEAVKV